MKILRFFELSTGCCADEFHWANHSRYDMERFGLLEAGSIEEADLLVVFGYLNPQARPEVKDLWEKMRKPKWVVAVGACACSGGIFGLGEPDAKLSETLPVDVFVPGCPPRPEAILNGILTLRRKMEGGTVEA
jgi:NADH:ubiquinone oxidoreductase subunit B-like Fe-S oxidoreductase